MGKGIATFLVLLVALGVLASIAAIAIPNFRQAQVPSNSRVEWGPIADAKQWPDGYSTRQGARSSHPSRWWIMSNAIVGGLLMALIVLGLLILLFKGLGKHEQNRALHGEEQEILRRMWEQGRRLEERVMNLETILMERDGAREFRKEF